jgi:hypothetical protein
MEAGPTRFHALGHTLPRWCLLAAVNNLAGAGASIFCIAIMLQLHDQIPVLFANCNWGQCFILDEKIINLMRLLRSYRLYTVVQLYKITPCMLQV